MTARLKKEYVFLTVFFAVYMFEYMVTSVLVNRGATGVVPASWQVTLYYIDQVFCVLGFAVFAIVRHIVRRPKVRVGLMSGVALLYAAGVSLLFFIRSTDVYMFIAPTTMLCLGILGGMVYYCMSAALADSGGMGRVMGIGGAAAVLLQYVLQLASDISIGLPFIMAAGLAMMAWLLYKQRRDWLTLDYLPYETRTAEHNRAFHTSVVCAVVVTTLLVSLCQFYDGSLEKLAVQSWFETYDPYSWPRLCMSGGYLAAGFVGDIGNRKYLPLLTLCVMLISILNPILLTSPDSFSLNLCLFYVHLGVCISYYNLAFWTLAPRTRCPELWASMGRILDGTLGFAMGFLHLSRLSTPAIVGLDVMMLAGVIVVMVINSDFALSTAARKGRENTGGTDVFGLFRDRYRLTPTEVEVLQKLLLTEDDLQQIADSIFISRRVLQRYVSSLYQKTGAKSRVGLYQLYHAMELDNR